MQRGFDHLMLHILRQNCQIYKKYVGRRSKSGLPTVSFGVISFFIIFANFSLGFTQEAANLYNEQIARTVERLTITEEYDRALQTIDSLMNDDNDADDVFLLLLRASTLCARTMDYEDLEDAPAVRAICAKVDEIYRNKNLDADSTGAKYFYLGTAYLYQALLEHRLGSLLSALKLSLKGAGYLEKAQQKNPWLWDVYYGLGMFQYNFSRYASIARSLGLVRDRRQQGVELLTIAATKGIITQYSARNALAWIDLENKNYAGAIAKSQALLNEFPGRRATLWLLSKALLRAERWVEAIEVLKQLESAIAHQTRNNHYNEITRLYMLTKAYYSLGRRQEAVWAADSALAIPLTKYVQMKKKNDLSELAEMKRRAGRNITR